MKASISSSPAGSNGFCGAIQGVDVPVVAAYLLLIALLYVVINLVVDLLYVLVDPRLRAA